MPLYEYQCQQCGHVATLLVRRADADKKRPCEECGSTDVAKLMSRPAMIRTKGGGSDSGELRRVDPRKAVENISRQYDRSGVDPGRGFEEVANRAARGDDPQTLKEAVREAKRNDKSSGDGKAQ